MIKYSTKDIIKRAEQLADLENSEFVSDWEKMSLLNESWVQLYQKIVNANDKTWIKTISVYDGIKLPFDFFQISALYIQNSKTQINKRNSEQFSGYEIRNNRLYLSNDYSSSNVVMEYYPVPQTLFFSSGKKEEVTFESSPKILIDEEIYLNSSNQIVNANGEILKNVNVGFCVKNGYLKNNTFYDWNGNAIETRTTKPFVIRGNEITFDDVENENLPEFLAYITDETNSVAFFVGKDFKVYTREKKATEITLSENSIIFCRQDGLYVSQNGNGKITRINGDVVENFSLSTSNFCTFVDSQNCIVNQFGKFYKTSYGFNTILDYPNNLYFILLSYMLAISFKMKQNGDVTLLVQKCEEISNQFFDSLSRDSNEFYTIKNVYDNNRGFRLWS